MAQSKDLVVAVVVRTEAEIKAATLRELADLWYSDAGPWADPLSTATWLRERADKIEGRATPHPAGRCGNPDCGGDW